VSAGIPTRDVLRAATHISAVSNGQGSRLGSIEVGMLADMILIRGDPVNNISDIRNVVKTIKDGTVFEAEALLRLVNVKLNN
jgi:imidazolonepropionase-like amidohydrolase